MCKVVLGQLVEQLLTDAPAFSDAIEIRLLGAALLYSLKGANNGPYTGNVSNGKTGFVANVLGQVIHGATPCAAA